MTAIDIVMPVHNEAESIEATLGELYHQIAIIDDIPVRFILCEDGSNDDTVEVLTRLSEHLPILLVTSPARKGYSRAVIDGFRITESPVVAFLDSDGQYDPRDFKKLLSETHQADFVLGFRNPRQDSAVRLWMSGAFDAVYRRLFPVWVKDPSCSFLMIRREALRLVLRGEIGLLKQGFWWEFVARATELKVSIKELPVSHRPRAAGQTQVYAPTKVPGIAYRNLVGLIRLKRELTATSKRVH